MCSPISLIMSEDNCFFPTNDSWNHSHTNIATINNLSTSLFGDKYARVEVRPHNNIFRNNETNEVFEVDDNWYVFLDENRTPGFWENDRVNQENRAREYAKKWLKNFDKKYLIPGYRETGGNFSTLIGGEGSTLTSGNCSTFCAGENSSFVSNYSDGKRFRTIVFYVGENGILPNKKYKIVNGKIYDFETGEEVKEKKTLKRKSNKKKVTKKNKRK